MTPGKHEPTPSLPVNSIWAPVFGRMGRGGRLFEKKIAGWSALLFAQESGGISLGGRRKLLPVGFHTKRAPLDLLSRFCRIAEAKNIDRAVVTFVRRWGLLSLCEHGIPKTHRCKKQTETTAA